MIEIDGLRKRVQITHIMVENTFITVSVTTASVIIIALVFVLRRINELAEEGEPTTVYKILASLLAYGALLGMGSAMLATMNLIIETNFKFTNSFHLQWNLLGLTYALFSLAVVVITIGIIFLVRREVGTGHIIGYIGRN